MAGLADAATDRCSVASAPALGTWSVCAWIKPTSSASFSPIVRVEAGGGTAMVFGLKSLAPSLYSAASTTGINGTSIGTGTYTFVAATRNGTTAALYWGTNPGSLTKVTGTVNSAGTPDTWTVWGRSPSDGSEWFPGVIAHLRTWAATVLTDAEVAAEGAASAPVKAGTWGVWPFGDNGSGGVSLNDTSGNARHLTAGTTPLTLVADPSLGPVAGSLSIATTATVGLTATTTRTAALAIAPAASVSLGAFADRPAALPISATSSLVTSAAATRAAALPIALSAAVDLAPLRTTPAALPIAATAQLDAAPVRSTPAALPISSTTQLDVAPVRTTPGALTIATMSQLDLVPLADRTAALDATSTASLVLAPVPERTAALAIAATAQLDVLPLLERAAVLAIGAQASLQLIPGGAIPAALAIAATAQLAAAPVRSTSAALDVAAVAAVVLSSALERPAVLTVSARVQLDVLTERQLVGALAIAVVARLLATAESDVEGTSLQLDVGRARDVPWLEAGDPEQRLQLAVDHVQEQLWLIIGHDRPR